MSSSQTLGGVLWLSSISSSRIFIECLTLYETLLRSYKLHLYDLVGAICGPNHSPRPVLEDSLWDSTRQTTGFFAAYHGPCMPILTSPHAIKPVWEYVQWVLPPNFHSATSPLTSHPLLRHRLLKSSYPYPIPSILKPHHHLSCSILPRRHRLIALLNLFLPLLRGIALRGPRMDRSNFCL